MELLKDHSFWMKDSEGKDFEVADPEYTESEIVDLVHEIGFQEVEKLIKE